MEPDHLQNQKSTPENFIHQSFSKADSENRDEVWFQQHATYYRKHPTVLVCTAKSGGVA